MTVEEPVAAIRSPFVVTVDFGTAAFAVDWAAAASVMPCVPLSNAALTAVGVAASTLLVVDVESLSCTAPEDEVDAEAIEMIGVAPPVEAIGEVAVTEVTPPLEAADHFSPVASLESAVRM